LKDWLTANQLSNLLKKRRRGKKWQYWQERGRIMTGHKYDGSLQNTQISDLVVASVEKAMVHAFVQEIFGPGQAAQTIEKAIDDNFITPQLEGSLTACQAVEAVGQDPKASEAFLVSTLGASKIPSDFYNCASASERADCMIDALQQNNVNLNPQEMKNLVDAAKQPGGQNKVKQLCNQMAANHPVV